MIEKWYCLRCDNCGEIINYWEENSERDAIAREKESTDTPTIASWDGRCFCDKKCQKEWLRLRAMDRRKARSMRKAMEKFVW